MGKYAAKTDVATDRSRAEIERDLVRFGASGFTYGWQGERAMIEFIYENKKIRFTLQMPGKNEFQETSSGRQRRSERLVLEAWEQAKKQRWRSLALIVKAKLVAVADGIKTFEHEFGMDIVMPDDRTVGEHVLPVIEQAYISGITPKLLSAGH